jgi:hypothetical protein
MTYNSVVSQVFAEFEREGFEYKYKYYPDLTVHQIFKNGIELIRVEVTEKSHKIVTEYRKLSPDICHQGDIIFKRLIREKNSYEWAIAEIKKLQTSAAIEKEGGFVISQCEYILPLTSKSFRSWLAHWIKTHELPAWDTPTGFIKLVQEYYEPFEGALVAEIRAETWAFRPSSQKNSGVRGAICPVKVEQCLAIRFEADVLPEDERKIRLETVCIYEPALACFEEATEAIKQKWPELAEPLTESKPTLNSTQEESKPWEQIPDRQWDRYALELWWKGYNCKEIADEITGIVGKTVRNRLTELRNNYKDVIVPRAKQLKKQGIK